MNVLLGIPIQLDTNQSWVVSSAVAALGPISGTASLSQSGAGILNLGGANTYGGGFTLFGTGKLLLSHSQALGTGTLALKSAQSGASVTMYVSNSITVTNPITIDITTGREAISSIGGNNSLPGGISVLGAGSNPLYLTSGGEAGSTFSVGSINGPGLTGAFSFRGAVGNLGAITGQVTLGGIFQINGGANWTVSSTGNTWTQTRLSSTDSGSFVLGANDALATTAKVLWDNNTSGALDLAGYDQTLAGLDCAATTYAPTVGNSSTSRDSLLRLNGGGYTFAGALVDVIGSGNRKVSLEILSGSQALTGSSTYSGSTTVTGGSLFINSPGSLNASPVTVKTNGTFGGSGTIFTPVVLQNGGSLTAGNGGVGNLMLTDLTLGSAAGDKQIVNVTLNSAIVNVSGVLTARGTTTINVGNVSLITPGVYQLITYTGTQITSGFALGTLPINVVATLQYGSASIDLNVTTGSAVPPGDVKWSGAVNGVWDTTTANWQLVSDGSATTYSDPAPGVAGAAVLFDDTLTTNPAVTLNRTVSPATVVFNNSATAYTLSGTGTIAGTNSFTKSGTNFTGLYTSNSFSGTVSLGGGSLIVTNASALGAGAKAVTIKSQTTKAELHLNGSAAPVVLGTNLSFTTYGEATANGVIVNETGDNIINSSLNMTSGGGQTKFNVFAGSLTFNGNITCNNGSSGKTLQLAGTGRNTINGVVQNGSKTASLAVLGGTWILNNTNLYTGATTVATNGCLVLNGSIANTAVTVQNGGVLSGHGTAAGAVTVQAGGFLQPGAPAGTLAISNNLTLQGTALLQIGRNGAALVSDQVIGLRTVTFGGTLTITNIGSSPLQTGDSFQLFSATNYTGNFAEIIYPDGYTFTNSLAVDGRIWVASVPTVSIPNFADAAIHLLPEGAISLTATGAIGSQYRIWASTNVALTPVTERWTLLTNGTVTVSPFTIIDSAATNFPRRFYLFSTP